MHIVCSFTGTKIIKLWQDQDMIIQTAIIQQ